MPPSETHNTFTFAIQKKELVVASSNDDLNTKSMCNIVLNHNQTVLNPPMEVVQNSSEKYSILKPTLLELSIFFRKLHISEHESIIELFELNYEGYFIFLERYHLPFHFSGYLLNEKFILATFKVDNVITSIEIRNLENISEVVCSRVFSEEDSICYVDYLVQNDIAYLIYVHFRSSKTNFKLEKIAFKNHTPYFVQNHPLKDTKVYALDRTPGNNSFITYKNGKSYNNGKICSHMDAGDQIAYVFDVLVRNAKRWNFVLLNGEVYITSYDAKTGHSAFKAIKKSCKNYMFILNDIIPFVQLETSRFYDFERLPVFFDVLNNSMTFLKPSTTNNSYFYDKYRFYDDTAQEWCTGFVTEEKNGFMMYAESEVLSFQKPENNVHYKISFNKLHYAAVYTWKGQTHCLINGWMFVKDSIHDLCIVGNSLWFVSNNTVLIMFKFDRSGIVIKAKEQIFSKKIRVVHNPYCEHECWVFSNNDCFFVRYEPDTDCFKFLKDNFKQGIPCFIDQSMIFCKDRVYEFDNNEVIGRWSMPNIKSNIYSPKPGVFVDFSVKKEELIMEFSIYSFDYYDYCFKEEKRVVSAVEFLSSCEISSIFSSFGHFKQKMKIKL
ncbi:hypothetical protein PCE1_001378 [Barthelona sp. PCE]